MFDSGPCIMHNFPFRFRTLTSSLPTRTYIVRESQNLMHSLKNNETKPYLPPYMPSYGILNMTKEVKKGFVLRYQILIQLF